MVNQLKNLGKNFIMTIKKTTSKSCCGSKNTILDMDKPIKKYQSDIFKNNGYELPKHFFDNGVFYVSLSNELGTLTATCSYGSKKMNLKCTGKNSDTLESNFLSLLESAISS